MPPVGYKIMIEVKISLLKIFMLTVTSFGTMTVLIFDCSDVIIRNSYVNASDDGICLKISL